MNFVHFLKSNNSKETILLGVILNYILYNRLSLERYILFIYHHLGWIKLNHKKSNNYTTRDLIIIFIRNNRDIKLTEENLFDIIGTSRQTFKKNFPYLLHKEKKLNLINLARFFNLWTGYNWKRIQAVPKGKIDSLETYYPKKIVSIANSTKIKKQLKEFGYNEDGLPRKIPPTIAQSIFERGIDPEIISYENFILKLDN